MYVVRPCEKVQPQVRFVFPVSQKRRATTTERSPVRRGTILQANPASSTVKIPSVNYWESRAIFAGNRDQKASGGPQIAHSFLGMRAISLPTHERIFIRLMLSESDIAQLFPKAPREFHGLVTSSEQATLDTESAQGSGPAR
jgi:hypothetical protein